MLKITTKDEQDGTASGQKLEIYKRSLGAKIFTRLTALGPIFFLTVVIPTVIAAIYFLLLSSDVYISESRFVVRSPDKPATSGLGSLLKTAGFSAAGDEVFAAKDFVESRDALRAIDRKGSFRRAYSGEEISYFNRFGTDITGGSFEDLYKYYSHRISVDQDSGSSITALSVRAFTPQDAQRFNEQLLGMAEATVNRLNKRGRQDLIQYAAAEVDEAKRKSQDAAMALSTYRNRQGVVDPERQASVQLQMISKLQDELIATRSQLLQLRSFARENAQIPVLETKIAGLSREIDIELGKVAGSGTSLSSSAAWYQRLMLENQFAEKQLAAAMVSLEEAKNEARRKQAYVERVVEPNLPDKPLEPRRITGVFLTFMLGLIAWGVLSMLLAGVLEHRD